MLLVSIFLQLNIKGNGVLSTNQWPYKLFQFTLQKVQMARGINRNAMIRAGKETMTNTDYRIKTKMLKFQCCIYDHWTGWHRSNVTRICEVSGSILNQNTDYSDRFAQSVQTDARPVIMMGSNCFQILSYSSSNSPHVCDHIWCIHSSCNVTDVGY